MYSVVMMSTPIQYVVPATSTIPPDRLFKAFVDSKNLLPKAVPKIVQSVENIEGNGEPGSIFKMTYAEGRRSKLERVDAIDYANHTYKYSVIDGDPLGDKLKKMSAEIKINATPTGGSSLNFTCICEPKDNNSALNADEIQVGKAKILGLFSAVNAYLSEHPDAYDI